MEFQKQKKDLFNCMFLLVNFIKKYCCVHLQTSFRKTQMRLLEKNNYIPQILTVLFIFMAFTFFVAFCLFSVIHISNNLNNDCNYSIEQSALLTWFQTDFTSSSSWNFFSLSRRISFPRNISMQRQGARKNGCFHRLHSAKLQSNTMYLGYAWGKIGGFGIDRYIYPSLK